MKSLIAFSGYPCCFVLSPVQSPQFAHQSSLVTAVGLKHHHRGMEPSGVGIRPFPSYWNRSQ